MTTIIRKPGGTFIEYPGALRALVSDRMLLAGLIPMANAVKDRAVATSPTGIAAHPRRGLTETTRREDESRARKRAYRYRESFVVRSGVGTTSRGGRRAYAQVLNIAQHALYVEWGNNNIEPYRVLRKAAGQVDFTRDRYTKKGTRGPVRNYGKDRHV